MACLTDCLSGVKDKARHHAQLHLLSLLLAQFPQPGQSSLLATTGNSATHPFLQEELLLGINTTLFFPTQSDFKLSRRVEEAEPESFHQFQALTILSWNEQLDLRKSSPLLLGLPGSLG